MNRKVIITAAVAAVIITGLAVPATRPGFTGLTAIAVMLGLYFLPAIIAERRKVPNTSSVFVIDLFLGWTVIGWIVALAMAMRDPRPAG